MNYKRTTEKTTYYRNVPIEHGSWHGKYGTLPEYRALGIQLTSLQSIKDRIDIELNSRNISNATKQDINHIIKINTTAVW